jgi:hypothetical protein
MTNICVKRLTVVLVAALFGCTDAPDQADGASEEPPNSQQQAAKPTPEELVKARALSRWQALREGDYPAVHQYISPGMRRIFPYETFASEKRGSVRQEPQSEVTEVKCSKDVCELQLSVKSRYAGTVAGMDGVEMVDNISERWINQKGQWWYMPLK